eukprot:TRINITY_DN2555_c0_g1_i11.p2 TRINITY_DN2555_c0_g1~~TRINITY_DN2555_c0_g1_i11.p2  ORF type:complete len:265 (-),score=68.00 TRINITY_DN2555_c0_g1_i11:1255-1974(-)
MATTTAPTGTAQNAEARLAALLKTAEALSTRLSALTPPCPPHSPPSGAATPATDATSNRLLLPALASMPSSRLLLTHPDYYSWPLEARRDHLGARAVSCLCKTILLVNTRCTREDCEDPHNPKHLMVVVPYGRKLNTQEVLRWSKARAPAGISGKNFNWRLGDGAAVTGYEYNAVTPLGSQSAVPIVVDESLVAAHGGGVMFLGGGGVLVKWRVRVDEFLAWAGGVVADFSVEAAAGEE